MGVRARTPQPASSLSSQSGFLIWKSDLFSLVFLLSVASHHHPIHPFYKAFLSTYYMLVI